MTTEAVLLFQLGPRVFAARAAGVARVAGPGPAPASDTCLGRPFAAARGLVVPTDGGGEATLAVDQVLGLRQVERSSLRPLPALAEGLLATRAVAGLVLLDGAPTPLIDLPTLIRERQAAAADARSSHG